MFTVKRIVSSKPVVSTIVGKQDGAWEEVPKPVDRRKINPIVPFSRANGYGMPGGVTDAMIQSVSA
jgi:hypothetical protein